MNKITGSALPLGVTGLVVFFYFKLVSLKDQQILFSTELQTEARPLQGGFGMLRQRFD